MNQILMYGLSISSIVILGYMLIKKFDIKIVLFSIGLILTIISGYAVGPLLGETSIHPLIDPFVNIINQFKNYLQGAGLTILILGGYTAYMTTIGANDMTVRALLKPINAFKNKYVLVIVVFLIGNLLSLVVPSASNLAIILLATLFPVLKASGMSTLTAAGVIATTATIMPTPLGSDNVAIAEQLGIPVFDYVFKQHALVSIPTLIAIAIVHALWQKHCDKKNTAVEDDLVFESKVTKADSFTGIKSVDYTILPLLPILILIGTFVADLAFVIKVNLSVHVVSLMSFAISLIIDLIFADTDRSKVLDRSGEFFIGMGNAMGIVVLTVAAAVFVDGLTSIGLIESLQTSMQTMGNSGIVLPVIMVIMTAVIVLLSGSGTSLFFAMIPLMVPLAAAAGISALALALPMGMAGNLLRAVSPVSAVIMIVAGTTKQSQMDIVRRTSVPMIFGTVMSLVLSLLIF